MSIAITGKQTKNKAFTLFYTVCGGEGIRTLDAIADIVLFESTRFNHSRTPPSGLSPSILG